MTQKLIKITVWTLFGLSFITLFILNNIYGSFLYAKVTGNITKYFIGQECYNSIDSCTNKYFQDYLDEINKLKNESREYFENGIIEFDSLFYSGNCPCPYNSDSRGNLCGERSSYSKNGEINYCYGSDVSDQMIAKTRTNQIQSAENRMEQAIQSNLSIYKNKMTVYILLVIYIIMFFYVRRLLEQGFFDFLEGFKEESLDKQLKDLSMMDETLVKICLENGGCDKVKGGHGDFGLSITNPIPVNGIMGEIKYLNQLARGEMDILFYHRLGSIEEDNKNVIDAYEVVSIDGKHWDILYFDMYHTRRSYLIPKGYRRSKVPNSFKIMPFGFGTHNQDTNFPFGIGDFIQKNNLVPDEDFKVMLIKHYKNFTSHKEHFRRPFLHRDRVRVVLSKIEKTTGKIQGVDIIDFDIEK